MWVSALSKVRCTAIVMGVSNLLVIIVGGFIIAAAYPLCDREHVLPYCAVSFAALARIGVMVQTGIAQESAAKTILESPPDGNVVVDSVIRLERRIKYKKWLWWSRSMMLVSVLQFVCAVFLVLTTIKTLSNDRMSSDCFLELDIKSEQWKRNLMVLFMIMMSFVALAQCFVGSDVLRWRSFYETQDNAWKYHYREMFDYGIRETLCCLGRAKYMNAMEEDEIHSVAQLLGDLVAYRASGTGHLKLLAGLVLLQRQKKSSESFGECIEAPGTLIREAASLHKFAEAAYTGPLLDVGRNPLIFPCAWLYRQGVLCPWTRNRRPVLDGDNWWRGHAAAFLKYVNLPPEVLRHGRVNQAKCKAAYFVVVLHHLQRVVITVRGTETPEDLITDGLCKECALSKEDLAGLVNCNHIHFDVKERVTSSFPHYGHSGIVEAARDIFSQIEGNPGEHESKSNGLLSTLLGPGGECFGYEVHIVGHSLGGAIAALLGIRLYQRYSNLHVYSYGPLPCVDSVVANACSEFVTSIVFGNEFSSCLSIGSVLRLRAAAITSLAENPRADGAMTFQLANQFLNNSKIQSETNTGEGLNHQICQSHRETNNAEGSNEFGEYSLWVDDRTNNRVVEVPNAELTNGFIADANSSNDPVSELIEVAQNSENGAAGSPPEMYLPGVVIHIVPEPKQSNTAHWTSWRLQKGNQYKAYLADREKFKDIAVSRSMFLDHLPWRYDIDELQPNPFLTEMDCLLFWQKNESPFSDLGHSFPLFYDTRSKLKEGN